MVQQYQFVALDPERLLHRRHLLDSYGQFAQLSILLVPLTLQIFYGLRLLIGRLMSPRNYQPLKEYQSPRVSTFKPPILATPSNVLAQIRWSLSNEIVDGWGTRQEWLVAIMWSAWLLVLVVKDTGDDYLHLTKRFGIVAASQLPLHYLLAFKAWSPIQYLTGLSHEELNPYHRLLGRIIITFFSLHATMYLNFFVQKGLLMQRVRDWDVRLGLAAIISALLIGTTALAKIRTWNYRLFFYLHVVLSLSLLPILYLHVSHLRLYVVEAGALYVILIIQRNVSQASANATIKLLPNTNLLCITIPVTKSLSSRTYTPGQYIYLGFPSLPQKLRINPFSIANPNPHADNRIQLIARTLSGTTTMLSDLAKTPQPTPLLIEGPYGSSPYFPDLATYDHILFVAGGVGATFTLPIYIDLLQRSQNGEQVPPIRFVWTVRKVPDAQWGVDQLRLQLGKLPGMELHVSRTETEREHGGIWALDPNMPAQGDVQAMELHQHKGSKSRIQGNDAEVVKMAKQGRPDLKAIVDEVFGSDANDRIAVLVCGTQGMGRCLRREVGKWVRKGRDVFWHAEKFGW